MAGQLSNTGRVAIDEGTVDSADVERHRGSLIVTQDIKFHRILVAKLLEEREHRTGITNVHTVDLLKNVPVLQTDFLIKAGGRDKVETEPVHRSIDQVGHGSRLG